MKPGMFDRSGRKERADGDYSDAFFGNSLRYLHTTLKRKFEDILSDKVVVSLRILILPLVQNPYRICAQCLILTP